MGQVVLVVAPSDGLLREATEALARLPETATRAGDTVLVRAAEPRSALDRLERGWVDLVLLDETEPGLDGFDLVPQIRRCLPRVAIALCGEGGGEALEQRALARRVSETLARPVRPGALALLLERTHEKRSLARGDALLRRELRRAVGARPIVAASSAMISVLERAEDLAASSAPALVLGEAGSGRESLARAIHGQSERHSGPFVVLHCADPTASYVESELFGRRRAEGRSAAPARRGLLDEARGGTLYLDAIEGLDAPLQARLCEVIEQAALSLEGDPPLRVGLDVRILASSALDLAREAKAGRFSAPLLAHFEERHIEVAPLRDRCEDLPLLADSLLARLRERHGKPVHSIDDQALEALRRYAWPGNLHELENVLEGALLAATTGRIGLHELPDRIRCTQGTASEAYALKPARRAAEGAAIRRALRATAGNRTHAARLLRISQRALLYKLKEYGIRD